MCNGNTAILKISLNAGTNNTVNINAADTIIAKINFPLLNGFVLNIDSLLILILNTWTNSERANTVNAIVSPIAIFSGTDTPSVAKPNTKAPSVSKPIITPW